MAVAANFGLIENDPQWKELTLPEQNQIRRAWVGRRMAVSNRPSDAGLQQKLEAEAFQGAPEFARPYKPSWKERHPSLYAAGETAYGVPMKTLETLQQTVANLLDPILKGKRYPATFGGLLQSLREPFQKTGEFMTGEREATELPGGEVSRIVTDPLMYTGLGEIAAAKMAARGAPAGVKMLPKLGRKAVGEVTRKALTSPGTSQWVSEIPRSWSTWNEPQRSIYKLFMQRGQQHLPKEQLQRVAETLTNAGPEEGRAALKILSEGDKNKIRSLSSWAEQPSWGRKALKGAKPAGKAAQPGATGVGPEVGGAGKTVVEAINEPEGYADILRQMMEEPSL